MAEKSKRKLIVVIIMNHVDLNLSVTASGCVASVLSTIVLDFIFPFD